MLIRWFGNKHNHCAYNSWAYWFAAVTQERTGRQRSCWKARDELTKATRSQDAMQYKYGLLPVVWGTLWMVSPNNLTSASLFLPRLAVLQNVTPFILIDVTCFRTQALVHRFMIIIIIIVNRFEKKRKLNQFVSNTCGSNCFYILWRDPSSLSASVSLFPSLFKIIYIYIYIYI